MTCSAAHPLRLYKREKLCSTVAIDRLFDRNDPDTVSALAYPLRAIWRYTGSQSCRFMIVVPKRKLHHAVDRVSVRRRVREAYRLNRREFQEADGVDIAFIYVADRIEPSPRIHGAMVKLLRRVASAAPDSGQ